jgi:hypothetical protein
VLFVVHRLLSPWWRRRQIPPKRRFLQEPHGVTTQKTQFFILHSLFLLHAVLGDIGPSKESAGHCPIFKIWGFHGGDYEDWRHLGCYAVRLLFLQEPHGATYQKTPIFIARFVHQTQTVWNNGGRLREYGISGNYSGGYQDWDFWDMSNIILVYWYPSFKENWDLIQDGRRIDGSCFVRLVPEGQVSSFPWSSVIVY